MICNITKMTTNIYLNRQSSHVFVILLLFANFNICDANDISIDSMIDMSLSSELAEHNSNEDNHGNTVNELLLTDGLWRCGNCSDIDSLNLVYNETNEFHSNIRNKGKEEIQIGLYIDEARCIIVKTEEQGQATIVSGGCTSTGDITLKFDNTTYCEISVYG